MRWLQGVAGVVSLVGAGYLLVAGYGRSGPPAVRLDPVLTLTPATHDFGEVESSAPLTVRFEIVNTYDQPAEVVQVLKGCSCAEATVEPRTIPAGGTGTLNVVWRVAGKQGRISEAVVLVCQVGSQTEHLRARVLAKMVLPVEPDQEVVELDSKDRRSERVVFRTRDGRPFRLTGAAANHPSLTAVIDSDGRGLTVTLDPTQPGWEGGWLSVTVTTDVLGLDAVMVWVRVKV